MEDGIDQSDPGPGGLPNVQIYSGGTLIGTATYIYTRNDSTTQHAVIELSIALSSFGSGNAISLVQWAPSCGNDFVRALSVITTIETEVPEPTSLALVFMGGLSFLGVRRFRKNG